MGFLCRICGSELAEASSLEHCTYCGQTEPADWACPSGHYICESCRTAPAEDLVERACLGSRLTDPLELAMLILRHPALPPYGPEHHGLAAPVLLSALRNLGVAAVGDAEIRQGIIRLRGIPPLVCATRGDCGAAASAGVVVSILRKATARSDAERSAALRATARALDRIAEHGGPRCCRQSVFDTIRTTWDLLRDELGLPELPDRRCQAGLEECKEARCPYFA
jgi:hypothetical protein